MTKDLDTEKLLPFIPLKRFGTAEEVAGEKSFLLIILCLIVCGLMGATGEKSPYPLPTHVFLSLFCACRWYNTFFYSIFNNNVL